MTASLSVIVPTCGRGRQLALLLDRLTAARQEMSDDEFEVIVSDDAPGPSTVALQAQYPAVRFVSGPARGPAANRNNGARFARAPWLVFVDDDCIPVDGWLRLLRDAADDSTVDVLEGSIIAPGKQDTIFHRYVENVTGNAFWSANLAIRRDVFDRIGRFDEDFGEAGGEDMELAHRFRVHRLRTVFCPEAQVVHPPHLVSWRAWLRFQFGIRWHVLYQLKAGETLSCDTPLWQVLPYAAVTRLTGLARVTWRVLRRPDTTRPRTEAIEIVLQWALMPLLIPHILRWEVKFRRMLRARSGAALLPESRSQ